MNKTIWIDFDNTPHVLFFRPIIPELEKRGHTVIITARDAYQVTDVVDLFHIKCIKVGRHYGKHKILKVMGTFIRAFQLAKIVFFKRPHIAVSHGSRSQVVACKLLFIKSISIFDYEHAASPFFSRPTFALAPEVVVKALTGHKKAHTIFGYPGIKEDVYVPLFTPDIDVRKELNIPESRTVVLVRPPATEAHYHNPEAEVILDKLLPYIDAHGALSIVVPRNHRQQEAIESKYGDIIKRGNLIIPKKMYDGLLLIWFADLVVSGGGTMNREATALGVPVYSIFRGKLGAVDRHLSETGKLVLIEQSSDVETKIKLVHRERSSGHYSHDNTTLTSIVNFIETLG